MFPRLREVTLLQEVDGLGEHIAEGSPVTRGVEVRVGQVGDKVIGLHELDLGELSCRNCSDHHGIRQRIHEPVVDDELDGVGSRQIGSERC